MTRSPHLRAVLQALLVTFLWSTSWVLIKIGLREVPPITFAGLRYAVAAAILLPGWWHRRSDLCAASSGEIVRLVLLALVMYAMTQGGQFLTLAHLDATPFSLLLNFTSVLVALAGLAVLRERPTGAQWAGAAVFTGGAVLYFSPAALSAGSRLGFALAGLTVLANAAAALLGRSVNRNTRLPPVVVTGVSMGIGAAVLLGVGLATHGLPRLTVGGWAIVVWLAAVNTAFAFTLWNRTLRSLTAIESSVINNTMLIQIAVLAWVFLGESLGPREIGGLALAVLGTVLVQWRRRRRRAVAMPDR